MKTLMRMAVASLPLTIVGTASAQNGNMMNGGSGSMWGNGGMGDWMGVYGGPWGPILLAVVVGFVVWIVMQNRK
ncbi:MAG: hypothetical protein K9J42_15240 [Sulfuritalea sp.]|nr:hypothetical protein [Sulfuritalea sp.]